MEKITKLIILLITMICASGCVALDRALNPITNSTHHYSFTHPDILKGGILTAGLVESHTIVDPLKASDSARALMYAIKSERDEFSVGSPESLNQAMNEARYHAALEQYKNERWVDTDLLNDIRQNLPERYVMFARIEDTYEYTSSYSSKREKKKKEEDKDSEEKSDADDQEEQEEEEEEEDIYDTSRSSSRGATISADVFDLAQDIIVWSGTRRDSVMRTERYVSNHYVGENSYTAIYPYPDFPSWLTTFEESARGLVVHFPHKTD